MHRILFFMSMAIAAVAGADDALKNLCLMPTQGQQAASATTDEMAEARGWVAAKFEGIQQPDWTDARIVVLANHGPVRKNARGADPLTIVDAHFDRGFYSAAAHVHRLQWRILPGAHMQPDR